MTDLVDLARRICQPRSPYFERADARLLAPTFAALEVWEREHPTSPWRRDEAGYLETALAAFFHFHLGELLDDLEMLRSHHAQLLGELAAGDEAHRRSVVDGYLEMLGLPPRELRACRRAMQRNFDAMAVAERIATRIGEIELRASVLWRHHGRLCGEVLELASSMETSQAELWQRLELDALSLRYLGYEGDPRVVRATFEGLASAVRDLHELGALDTTTLQYVYRAALDGSTDVWIQREALGVLASIAPDAFSRALAIRLREPGAGDDRFVRARAVELWAARAGDDPGLADLGQRLLEDESALVRQRLAECLGDLPGALAAELLPALLIDDPAIEVRAAAALALPRLIAREAALAGLLQARLGAERDAFVYRVLLEALLRLGGSGEAPGLDWPALIAVLTTRHQQDPDLRVRTWTALARERLTVMRCRELGTLEDRLARDARRYRVTLPEAPSGDALGRAASALAQDDFAFDLSGTGRTLHVRRGFWFGRAVWRILHELRHPGTGKRQGFRHTVARQFFGHRRAPSHVLAEVSPTQVPGEPLIYPSEDSWREWLPLVDDVLAALDQGFRVRTHQIFTAEGVAEIEPPRRAWQRFRAWAVITVRYAEFAALRNWQDEARPPSAYVEALGRLGISVRLRPYMSEDGTEYPLNPHAERFFAALTPLPWLESLWTEFSRSVLSPWQNTLGQLLVFSAAVAAWFFGRHVALGLRMRAVRRSIPLVLGGWGTRGKSGTERLKAALINALGYGLCSKTTGCEAMLVLARPMRPMRELLLYRPYDKATIWEQFEVARTAADLGADVMMWECMGLTPSYVQVLQQRWMRDDIATITNAFPDHEDLQGPAGINVPEVMCEFIPRQSTLLTSEEYMLPILRADARAKGTAVHACGWLEAGLITEDVLARFPYEEHRYNIALVLSLAEALGVERDVALKEMADRVIMDLGVLKTYPEAEVDGRVLQFIMGMSANERYGALNNWQRMGLDELSLASHPGEWVVTLVNNRADRVARSQVFARILVEDVEADLHVLIGSNLQGLRGYIEEALDEWLGRVSLGAEGGRDLLAQWQRWARAQRVPVTREELAGRLAACAGDAAGAAAKRLDGSALAMLATLEVDEEALPFCQRWCAAFDTYRDIGERLARGEEPEADLEAAMRRALHDWFTAKILQIDNPGISGDELVVRVVAAVPPNVRARIMGMQNIKGAGLEWVYAWQAFEPIQHACRAIMEGSEQAFAEGLRELAQVGEFGPLSRAMVGRAIEHAAQSIHAQRETRQAMIASIEARLESSESVAERQDVEERPFVVTAILRFIESLADAGDAVRRRRRADRVYTDLTRLIISEAGAARELQRINARQRGGWLTG